MDILMTISAPDSDLPETPFLLLFMTCDTGSCQVGSLQFEIPVIMLLNRIESVGKSFCAMAIRTILHIPLPGELSFMIIGMAIHATIMFQGNHKIIFVTGFTWQVLMFVLQRVIGPGVVKSCTGL